ncbi:MAG: hypothetical protein NC926_08560 [Candidatus Omnitrophica bacterium]|nr:hypothetical protein [Candidatus Omnitrophota bacterium]
MSEWIIKTDGERVRAERKIDLKKGKWRMVIQEVILWMTDKYGGYDIVLRIYDENNFPVEIKTFYETFPKEVALLNLENYLDEKTQAIILEIAEKYGFKEEAEDFLADSYLVRGLEALGGEEFSLLLDKILRALYSDE